jgi:hypothetical protein
MIRACLLPFRGYECIRLEQLLQRTRAVRRTSSLHAILEGILIFNRDLKYFTVLKDAQDEQNTERIAAELGSVQINIARKQIQCQWVCYGKHKKTCILSYKVRNCPGRAGVRVGGTKKSQRYENLRFSGIKRYLEVKFARHIRQLLEHGGWRSAC